MTTSFKTETKSDKSTIVVICPDYDGCLGNVSILQNPYYREAYLHGRGYSEDVDTDTLWGEFVDNSYFGKMLHEHHNNDDVSKMIILSGSNRTTMGIDLKNRTGNFAHAGGMDTGSSFIFYKNFSQFLTSHLDSNKIVHDPRTIYDIWYEYSAGHHFGEIESEGPSIGYPADFIKELSELENNQKKLAMFLGQAPFFDHSKISLLYCLIHSIAKEHPEENIVFEFVDDVPRICNALFTAFQAHPELIPANVELRINHYDLTLSDIRKKITASKESDIVDFEELDVMEHINSAPFTMNSFSKKIEAAPIQGKGKASDNLVADVKLFYQYLENFKITKKPEISHKKYPPDDINDAVKLFLAKLTSEEKMVPGSQIETDLSEASSLTNSTSISSSSTEDHTWDDWDSTNVYVEPPKEDLLQTEIENKYPLNEVETSHVQPPAHLKAKKSSELELKPVAKLTSDAEEKMTPLFDFKSLKAELLEQMKAYFLTAGKSFFRNKFLAHRKDTTDVIKVINTKRFSELYEFQDIAVKLLNEWQRGCNKHSKKFRSALDKDAAMLAYLQSRKKSYYLHILKSLQLVAAAYLSYRVIYAGYPGVDSAELQKLVKFLPAVDTETSRLDRDPSRDR